MHMAGGLASLRCDYCKNMVYAAPDDEGVRYLDELEDLQCPVCMIPLWNATLGNIPFRACKKCRGMLVKMNAFEAFIDRERSAHPGTEMPLDDDGSDLNRKLECPQCHRAMDAHFYYGGGHVVMNDCERCELNWLDGGGLLRIAHAPHSNEAVE